MLALRALNHLLDFGIERSRYELVLIRLIAPLTMLEQQIHGMGPEFEEIPSLDSVFFPAMAQLLAPDLQNDDLDQCIDVCFQDEKIPENVDFVEFYLNLSVAPHRDFAPWVAAEVLRLDALNELLKLGIRDDEYESVLVYMGSHVIYKEYKVELAHHPSLEFFQADTPTATQLFFPACAALRASGATRARLFEYYDVRAIHATRAQVLQQAIVNCFGGTLPSGAQDDWYDLYMTRAPIDRLLARHG